MLEGSSQSKRDAKKIKSRSCWWDTAFSSLLRVVCWSLNSLSIGTRTSLQDRWFLLWFLSVGTSGREDIKERQFLDGSAHSELGKAVKLPLSPSGNPVSDAWRLITSQSDARGLVRVSPDSKTESRTQKLCSSLGPGPWLSGIAVCLSSTSQREAVGCLRIPDSLILFVWTWQSWKLLQVAGSCFSPSRSCAALEADPGSVNWTRTLRPLGFRTPSVEL